VAAPGVTAPVPANVGTFNADQAPPVLPVYQYTEPSGADLQAAATGLSNRTGLTVKVAAGDAVAGTEPSFSVSGLDVPVGALTQAAAAQSFLGAHDLLPTYGFQVLVGTDRVVYGRQFTGPSGPAPEVTLDGRPVGLEVDFSGDRLVAVRGPLELALASATYPLRALGAEDRAASGSGRSVRLVYVLVISGGRGFYEPELLLTGAAGSQLQPVIAPQWLRQ